ncbi:unnamed protein product [Agarophyton chilense]
MRGWMGGKRRHITVRRRDPVARLRQQFARRRELARQSAPLAQKTGARVSMSGNEDHAKHGGRPSVPTLPRGPRALPNASNRVRKDPTQQQYQCGDDIIMIGDPSQLESIVPEFRNAKKRLRDHVEHEEQQSKRRSVSLRQEQGDAFDSSYPSNDIRVFDADGEKTPLFRRRTLPSTFLNSEATNRHRTSKYFAKGSTFGSKRFKVSPTPDLSSRLAGLRNRVPRHIEGPKRDARDAIRKGRDELERQALVEQQPQLLASPLSNFQNTRNPLEDHSRPVRSPSELYASNVASSRARDPIQNLVKQRISESPEFVRTSPAGWIASRAGSRFQAPGLSARNVESVQNIRTGRIESRFPLIEADSDSSHILSPVEERRSSAPTEFRSLLASDPITVDDFSAEVQMLEAKMLEKPDSGGGRFNLWRRQLRPSETDHSRQGFWAEGDVWMKAGGVGSTVNGGLNKRLVCSTGEAGDIGPMVSGKGKETECYSSATELEEQGRGIVDVTLVTTERNPINAAKGKRSTDEQMSANLTV